MLTDILCREWYRCPAMKITYNLIAGQSVERLAALSDNTFWSIAFIVVVQLNYVIAPRLWGRKRDEEV